MLRHFLFILYFIGESCPSWATAQAPDYLIVGTDTLLLFSNPLETLPDKAEFARKFLNDWNTGCWRGYRAYWQSADNKLYLTNIRACSSENRPVVPLIRLFGSTDKQGRVFADWVTGELICPTGKLLKYYHDGYRSIYEYETAYQIKKGIIDNKTVFDNRRTKISIYEVDHEKLKTFIYSRINWSKLPALPTDSIIMIFISIKHNSDGQGPIIELLKGAHPVWNTEVMRVLRLLPEWSVDYVRGTFQPTSYNFPVLLSEAYRKRYAEGR